MNWYDASGSWRRPWWFWRTVGTRELFGVSWRYAISDTHSYRAFLKEQGVRYRGG